LNRSIFTIKEQSQTLLWDLGDLSRIPRFVDLFLFLISLIAMCCNVLIILDYVSSYGGLTVMSTYRGFFNNICNIGV